MKLWMAVLLMVWPQIVMSAAAPPASPPAETHSTEAAIVEPARAASADAAPAMPAFVAYDMSGLSWLPPSLQGKGYETIPVFFMCHMWNGRFGKVPTNCNNVDFSGVNHEVVRQRAQEALGLPLVVIDIEQTSNPTTHVWHMVSENPQQVMSAVALWQELIATWREVNQDTRIMIYKPIPRIWWPMQKNRKWPMMARGQESIDARTATTKLIAPLFADQSLMAWPSAYLNIDAPELLREERQWQIHICKEVYKTRCVFALTPFYTKLKTPEGEPRPIHPDMLLQVMHELEEDGADGFGIWMPRTYNNKKYLGLVRQWAETGEQAADAHDPSVWWLSAVDRFLSGQ
jgi:hypothetical protein